MPHRTEHLFASEHELDRFSNRARGDGAENLRAGDQAFAAKAAAEKRTADVNVFRRYAEQAGQTCLRQRKTLAGRIYRERVAGTSAPMRMPP
jgi:hypothetical protein